MDSATFAYVLLWIVLAVYAVLATIDFGAGFYYWLAGWRPGNERVRTLTRSYLSPVWETTNVFLVLFIVGMIGFFPGAVRAYATGLLLPLSAAVIMLTVRGACFAFAHVAPWADRYLAPIFGLGGLLILAFLVSFFSASEDGAILLDATGAVRVDQARLWLSPLNVTLALLAMALAAYLSAAFLARYATQRHDTEVAAFFRAAAARSGLLAGALAGILAIVLHAVAPFHFASLAALWPLQFAGFAAFVVGIWLLARGGRGRSGLAAGVTVGQFVLALLTFGLTRLPYLVYPTVRAADALTPPATYAALLATLAGGAVVVMPSLALLYALFLKPSPGTSGSRAAASLEPARPARLDGLQVESEVSSALLPAGSRK
jgi:cytochrome bd ubiquinol oxidase subunit II